MSAYMRMLVCGIISNYRSLDAVYIYIYRCGYMSECLQVCTVCNILLTNFNTSAAAFVYMYICLGDCELFKW